jgi:hypothetical protein
MSTQSGTAKERGASATEIKLKVTPNTGSDLTEITINVGTSFSGKYVKPSATLIVAQSDFTDISAKFAGGASQPVSIDLADDGKTVNLFTYAGIMIPPVVAIFAARDAVDSAIPASGVTSSAGSALVSASASGSN